MICVAPVAAESLRDPARYKEKPVMGSIGELCWTSTEDLFRELDLDGLYARQVGVLGSFSSPNYPYLVLIYTGKITIGINLSNSFGAEDFSGRPCRAAGRNMAEDALSSWPHAEEHTE